VKRAEATSRRNPGAMRLVLQQQMVGRSFGQSIDREAGCGGKTARQRRRRLAESPRGPVGSNAPQGSPRFGRRWCDEQKRSFHKKNYSGSDRRSAPQQTFQRSRPPHGAHKIRRYAHAARLGPQPIASKSVSAKCARVKNDGPQPVFYCRARPSGNGRLVHCNGRLRDEESGTES